LPWCVVILTYVQSFCISNILIQIIAKLSINYLYLKNS
jgi:hypothetical protein